MERMRSAFVKFRHSFPSDATLLAQICTISAECLIIDQTWRIPKKDRKKPKEFSCTNIGKEMKVEDYLSRWCIQYFGQTTALSLFAPRWEEVLNMWKVSIIQEAIPDGTFHAPKHALLRLLNFGSLC